MKTQLEKKADLMNRNLRSCDNTQVKQYFSE